MLHGDAARANGRGLEDVGKYVHFHQAIRIITISCIQILQEKDGFVN
jgi:hypothetical protein